MNNYPKNTNKDLLETADSSNSEFFFCPKCGAQLSMRLPSSVAPIFNEVALDTVNQWLQGYRTTWLAPLTRTINSINDGITDREPLLDPRFDESNAQKEIEWIAPRIQQSEKGPAVAQFRSDGIFRKGEIAEELNSLRLELEQRFDDLTVALKFGVPPVAAIDTLNWKVVFAIVDTILLQLEPADFFATLTDIVTSQPSVQDWVQKTKRAVKESISEKSSDKNSFFGELCRELRRLCPDSYRHLWDYLDYLGRLLEDEKTWIQGFSENTDMFKNQLWFANEVSSDADVNESVGALLEKLRNRFERGCFLATLFSMHETNEGEKVLDDNFKSVFGKRDSSAYLLPEMAILSYRQMTEFLLSAETLQFDLLNLRTEYGELLRSLRALYEEAGNQSEVKLFKDGLKDPKFRHLIDRVFGFACNGRATRVLEFLENPTDGEAHNVHHEVCGWYPKPYPTIGVLLLGTPGCGKSMAFLSGATILNESTSSLRGLAVKPDDPRTFYQVNKLEAMFNNGEKPNPTNRKHHHALSFQVSQGIGMDNERLGFVFVDIPGELATLQQREGVNDPIVSNTLAHSNIIMLFLDLNTDSKISSRFIQGPHAQDFENFELAQTAARVGRDSELTSLDQIQFVKGIADRCAKLRVGKDMPRLFLVFPKCDLYIDNEKPFDASTDKRHMFLDSLFHAQIENETLYYPLPAPQPANMSGVTSRGGNATTLEQQIETLKQLTEGSRSGLSELGAVVASGDGSLNPEAKRWNQIFPTLLDELEDTFGLGKIQLLPISAMGAQNPLDIPDRPKFAQKLTEYVFLGPIIDVLSQRVGSN